MMVRDYFRTHRFHLVIMVLAIATLAVAVFWTAFVVLRTLPPHTVVMVTGPEGGAYYEVGKRYSELLAHEGIELRLLPTAGALENLTKLNDPQSGVSVGFLQGGITDEKVSPDLASLGTIFYEPLWFFYRDVLRGKGLDGLRGRRISIGPEGSGTRALALRLLARNGIDERFADLLSLTPQQAGEKLLGRGIDATLMVASWDSPVVRRLLAAERIDLVSFPRADAYVALYPFLNKVVVPAGVGDMVKNQPPTNVVLLAPKASLVVREDVHPAIQYLLLDAAMQIHSGPGIFHKAGQFPAAESIDLPLSDEARQFYKTGRPFLQRYLPFWLAVLIGRLLVLLIPVVGILYPLVRFVPALFGWKMRRRIYKLYGELRSIERAWEARDAGRSAGDLAAQLDQLENKADRLWAPVSSMGILYLFKEHIALVRNRLEGTSEKTYADVPAHERHRGTGDEDNG